MYRQSSKSKKKKNKNIKKTNNKKQKGGGLWSGMTSLIGSDGKNSANSDSQYTQIAGSTNNIKSPSEIMSESTKNSIDKLQEVSNALASKMKENLKNIESLDEKLNAQKKNEENIKSEINELSKKIEEKKKDLEACQDEQKKTNQEIADSHNLLAQKKEKANGIIGELTNNSTSKNSNNGNTMHNETDHNTQHSDNTQQPDNTQHSDNTQHYNNTVENLQNTTKPMDNSQELKDGGAVFQNKYLNALFE